MKISGAKATKEPSIRVGSEKKTPSRTAARVRALRAIQARIWKFSDASVASIRSMKLLPVRTPARAYELMACATVPNVEGLRRQLPAGWYLSHIGTRRRDRGMVPVWFVTLKREDDPKINVTVSRRALLSAVIAAAMVEAVIKDTEIKEKSR